MLSELLKNDEKFNKLLEEQTDGQSLDYILVRKGNKRCVVIMAGNLITPQSLANEYDLMLMGCDLEDIETIQKFLKGE